jgi:3'(2'), 5'-bisphosphate nucleotidase
MNYQTLSKAVITISQQAGEAILEIYDRDEDLDITTKENDSPLTEADLAAHRIIVDSLRELTPALPILSEESRAVSWQERQSWQTYWLVDPLDGTKEFIARNGEFTVNIALIEAGRPVLGVVHIPVSDTTYSGIPGVGAWREANERAPSPISVRRVARPPLRVLGSRSHGSPHLAEALATMGPHELIAAGSSIKLCLVADGSCDLYPRLGPTSEWDIGAGQAVVEAAGGQVVELTTGQPLRYNSRPTLLNPQFMAYGDPDCWRRWPRP